MTVRAPAAVPTATPSADGLVVPTTSDEAVTTTAPAVATHGRVGPPCLDGMEEEEDGSIEIIMGLLECIHLLCYCDTVEFADKTIGRRQFQEDAVACLSAVWTNYVQPRLMVNGMHPLPYDDDQFISLSQLVEALVALVVDLARHVQADSTSKLFWLVQQVCASEIAGTIAVHKGMLDVFAKQWLPIPPQEEDDANMKMMRAAVFSVRHLSLVQDLYTAGWIHMEMMRQGVIQAVCNVTHYSLMNNHEHHNDVSMAVAEILVALCGAPHTRIAVVQGKCFGFLVQHLTEISEENKLPVLNALVELVAVAIKTIPTQKNAMVLHHGFLTPDLATALLK